MSWTLTALEDIQPYLNMPRPLILELDYSLSPRAKTLWSIIDNTGWGPCELELGVLAAIFNCTEKKAQMLIDELLKKEAIFTKVIDGNRQYAVSGRYLKKLDGIDDIVARLAAYYEVTYDDENEFDDNFEEEWEKANE